MPVRVGRRDFDPVTATVAPRPACRAAALAAAAGAATTLAFEPVAWALLAPLGGGGLRAVPARGATAAGLDPRAGLRARLRAGAAGLDARGRAPTRGSRSRGWRRSSSASLGAGGRAAHAPPPVAAAGRRWPGWPPRCGAASGRSAGCPGAGWRSPSSTPRSPTRCRGSARTASASLLALIGHRSGLDADRRLAATLRRRGDGGGAAWPWSRVPGLAAYTLPSDGSATVAAVQGNVPGDGSDILLDHRQVTRNHLDATVALAADVAAGREPARTSSSGRRTRPRSTRSATPRST